MRKARLEAQRDGQKILSADARRVGKPQLGLTLAYSSESDTFPG